MISSYFPDLCSLCNSIDKTQVEKLVEILYQAYERGSQIFIFGNGGSGATASHFCEDLGKGTLKSPSDKRRFRVISLTDSIPYLLAWANDEGYETVFEQQLRNLGRAGDVAIGISGSGKSRNVLRAIEYAKSTEMITVGMTGFDGGELARKVSYSVHIPSSDMGMVENFHLIIVHLVVDCLKKRMKNRAVFLNRDGVINQECPGYVKSWNEFTWISGSKEALRCLHGNGFLTIVVTNQSVVGRGLIDAKRLDEIHDTMRSEVESVGGGINQIYYCPHPPEAGCDCRKPKPGLLLKAEGDFDISLSDSYMVADTIEDVEMAKNLGCKTVLVCTGRGREEIRHQTEWNMRPDYILADLSSAAEMILKLEDK